MVARPRTRLDRALSCANLVAKGFQSLAHAEAISLAALPLSAGMLKRQGIPDVVVAGEVVSSVVAGCGLKSELLYRLGSCRGFLQFARQRSADIQFGGPVFRSRHCA